MAQEICNKATRCPERRTCGGARPHSPCSECGTCPVNKEAKCEPIDKSDANCGHCSSGWCLSSYGCDHAIPSTDKTQTGCERAL